MQSCSKELSDEILEAEDVEYVDHRALAARPRVGEVVWRLQDLVHAVDDPREPERVQRLEQTAHHLVRLLRAQVDAHLLPAHGQGAVEQQVRERRSLQSCRRCGDSGGGGSGRGMRNAICAVLKGSIAQVQQRGEQPEEGAGIR